MKVTRVAAAKALLAAAWAVVTYAKAQLRYSTKPSARNLDALHAAARKRAQRVRFANALQDQLRGK
jgi:hypothetical protein